MKLLIFVFSMVLPFVTLAAGQEGPDSLPEMNSQCSDATVKNSGLTTEQRLEVAKDRGTDAIVQILNNPRILGSSEEWIVVDLVQDQSHLRPATYIPTFVMTFAARLAFNQKLRRRIHDDRPKADYPQLLSMYFLKARQVYKGKTAEVTAHTFIRMKAKDLPVIADWFVESLHDVASGSRVFKIMLAR